MVQTHLPPRLQCVSSGVALGRECLQSFRSLTKAGSARGGGVGRSSRPPGQALQGRVKVSKDARSATMMYSYVYTLTRRGVVAMFDLSADNLALFTKDH